MNIDLPKGLVAVIDDEDAEIVLPYSWAIKKYGRQTYAVSRQRAVTGNKRILIHRLILGTQPEELVDHRNGNGLDNRRGNIRIVTRQQNAMNRSRRSDSKSKYKGVVRCTATSGFHAIVIFKGVRYRFGPFRAEIDAAMAYDAKARQLHGEFAAVNIPMNSTERCCL